MMPHGRWLAATLTLASLAGPLVAATTPSVPPARHPMPAGWKLPEIEKHPALLFGPEDAPAIKARLTQALGSLDQLPDKFLLAYLAGDEAARRKATADFVAYWKNYSQRWTKADLADREHPAGVGMRGIWRCLYLYDIVESFGYLTDAQRTEFRDRLVECVHWSIGPSKAERRYQNDNWRNMNIYTDVVLAAGTTALAFPELPEAREWIEFATDELEWQLENSIWDGTWHESPRYQAHMLKITGLFYRSLKRRTGVDMFQHENYKAMLDWFIRFGTPLDKVAGETVGRREGVTLSPGIGDASWTNVPFGLCAMFAPEYLKTDPAFSARLMWAWDRGGRPYSGDSVEWAWVLIDPALPAQPQTLGSDSSPGKGYVLMRSGFDTPEERWFLLRCGRRALTGHDNADWNAFNLHAFGYPLALDSGSGAYSDPAHKAWNDKAIAHNTVVFGDRSQERKDGKVVAFASRPDADYSVTDASVPAGVERYVRNVVFVKPSYFVVWDQIKATEPANWVIHTTATDFQWGEHQVRCLTPWQVNLDVHVLLPEAPLRPGIEKGAFETKGKGVDNPLHFSDQNYLKIPGTPGANFLTVLNPLKSGQAPLSVKRSGTPDDPVLEITSGTQRDRLELHDGRVVLTRSGPVQASVVLGRGQR